MSESASLHHQNDDHRLSALSESENNTNYSLEDENGQEQVCEGFLAISYSDFQLGASFYQLGSDTIELLHEVYEYHDFNYIKTILRKLNPTDVMISSKCDPLLMNYLLGFAVNNPTISATDDNNENDPDNELAPNSSNESDASAPYAAYNHDNDKASQQFCPSFRLHFQSNRIFQFEQCRTRILSMNLPQMANMVDFNERFIYLSSNINFSEANTIKSLGVLLYFLEKNPSYINLVTQSNYPITNFSYFNHYFVTMDHTTFEALEIFQQEWHPSTLKKGIYKKEGLSVYGIFNTCSSKLGSFELKKLFQQPVTDYNVLSERQATIEFFLKPVNKNLKDILAETLKYIKDISPVVNRFKMFNFQFSDFETLLDVISSMIHIRNAITQLNVNLALFSQITNNLTNELDEVCNCMKNIIDFENSNKSDIEIRPNIDAELDELRAMNNRLPEILNRMLLDESEENNLVSLNLRHLTNVFIPQIGFLLSLPLLEAQKAPSMEEEYGFEMIFCANDRVFYKNSRLKEFDVYYGDITYNISEQTRKVLTQVREFIFQRKKTINASISLCAQLDAMIALANVAINYKYVRPSLNTNGVIQIQEGRHPLYELFGQSFKPNPFSSDNENKVAVIFGPNSCGKSVYLKQVCLIVYLAHIGSYVPASSADIALVDQICTRIRTPESISTQLSSFKHDLNQMIIATKYATRHSLVVIDFFGKGTLSIDGFALLSAYIKYWIGNYNRPYTIISSQFNIMSTLPHSNGVKYYTFQVQTGANAFTLIECENVTDHNSSCSSVQLLGSANRRRMEKLMVDDDIPTVLQKSFPTLKNKYCKYIELFDYVIDQSESDDFLDNLSKMIETVNNSFSLNKNK